jgi:hypothetical protein
MPNSRFCVPYSCHLFCIKTDNMHAVPFPNPLQYLQGRVPVADGYDRRTDRKTGIRGDHPLT